MSGRTAPYASRCPNESALPRKSLARSKVRRSPTWEGSRHQTPAQHRSMRCARMYSRLKPWEIAESAKLERRITGRGDNFGGHERVELFAIVIVGCRAGERAGSGMKINLAEPGRQIADQAGETGLGHVSRPLETENMIGRDKAGGPNTPAQQTREGRRKPGGSPWRLRLHLSQHLPRVQRYAPGAQAESLPDPNHQSAAHRLE